MEASDQQFATCATPRLSIVDELHAAVTQLETDLEILESQLCPILRCAVSRPIADEIRSEPGSQIRHVLNRVIDAAQRVRDTRERLEV